MDPIERMEKSLKELRQDLLAGFSTIDLNRIRGDWWRFKEDGSYTYPLPTRKNGSKMQSSQENKTLDYLQPAIAAYCAGNEWLLTEANYARTAYVENIARWFQNKRITALRDSSMRSSAASAKQPCISKDKLQEAIDAGISQTAIAASCNVSAAQISRLKKKWGIQKNSK